jgi:hypothetical protein
MLLALVQTGGRAYVGISAIGTNLDYLRNPCRRRDICCNSLRGGGLLADCVNFALAPPTKSPESVGCAGCPQEDQNATNRTEQLSRPAG